MTILVTGGAGYIGSHTVIELLENNFKVIIVDNFSNSSYEVLESIREISKKDFIFYEGDVCDKKFLEKIFNEHNIDAVIHFAGYKAVGESVAEPIMYYENNLISTLSLCDVMKNHDCKQLVFSSSATVYRQSDVLPLKEDFPLGTTNPYGTTKLMIEQILQDLYVSDNAWNIMILRYFNPIGAHESGLIGEKPNGIPNNLMPYIVKVANGELPELKIFGNDYNTNDGTGVRDYIHVVDLAKGHIKALEGFNVHKGVNIYNLGTGVGYSVLDLVNTFSNVNNVDVKYLITDRRPGDIGQCYGDPTKAYEELGWKTTKTIEDMCRDSYNYVLKQQKD